MIFKRIPVQLDNRTQIYIVEITNRTYEMFFKENPGLSITEVVPLDRVRVSAHKHL